MHSINQSIHKAVFIFLVTAFQSFNMELMTDKTWGTEGKISTTHGKIAYVRSKNTTAIPPVVFLHGNSASSWAFQKQFEELGDKLNMIAFDFPGHGNSDDAINPEETYSFPGNASAIYEAMSFMELENPIICGWSFGGHVAIDMLGQHPEYLSRLLITGTPPIELTLKGFQSGFYPFEGAQMMSQSTAFTKEEACKFLSMGGLFLDENHPLIQDGMRTDPKAREFRRKNSLLGKGVNQKEVVQTTKIPILIIAGMEDKGINHTYIKEITEGLEHVTMKEIKANHSTFWNEPQQFNHLLEDFVTKNRDQKN